MEIIQCNPPDNIVTKRLVKKHKLYWSGMEWDYSNIKIYKTLFGWFLGQFGYKPLANITPCNGSVSVLCSKDSLPVIKPLIEDLEKAFQAQASVFLDYQ